MGGCCGHIMLATSGRGLDDQRPIRATAAPVIIGPLGGAFYLPTVRRGALLNYKELIA